MSPSDPVMGEVVWYTAVNDGGGPPVASYKWEYKFTSGSCQGNWIDSGQAGYYAGFIESRPGTWDVRLTVTYNPPPVPPRAPTVITKSVTIAPATKFTTIAGLDTPTPYTSSIVLKFRVEAASRPCGPYVCANLAQEKITNWWQRSPPFYPDYLPDGDWVPGAADPAFQFQPGSNEIWDTHSHNYSSTLWASIPTGIYITVTQSLRIKYVDPCSETRYIDLGSHVLKHVKVDANNWKVTEGP
ncbi:MAG: hypothetical protein ACYC4N_24445 [Pirellulaceae bacterium]